MVEEELDQLLRTLRSVEDRMNVGNDKEASSFVIYNKSFEKNKESLKIEETLSLFYDSTKWLENAALDLEF